MIKHKYILPVIAIALSFSWISCEQERDPCFEPKTYATRIGFYIDAETDTGITTASYKLPNAIIGTVDSPFFFAFAQKEMEKFSFVLSPLVDSTRIYIIPDSAKQTAIDIDTLTFFYQRRLHFISTGCGYSYFYAIQSVRNTNNQIDSVSVFNGDVTDNANIEHVKIYY